MVNICRCAARDISSEFRRFVSPLVAASLGDVFIVEAFIGVPVWLARATLFRRNKVLHAIAIRLGSVGGTRIYGCRFDGSAVVGAGSTAQFLEARFVTCVPRDVRTDFGVHHRCAVQLRVWLRLPGERCTRCIDERPLIELCSNMSSNVGSQGQQRPLPHHTVVHQFLSNPHMSHRHEVLLLSVLCSPLGVP